MRIILKHPRVLGDGSKGSMKHYGHGQHEISDAVADHWFTRELMKTGDISVVAEKPAKKSLPPQEGSKDEKPPVASSKSPQPKASDK